jgi:competence protein ComEC
MELENIDGTPATGKLRVSVREETALIGYGDAIRVTGKLFAPRSFDNPGGFDYPAYLAQNGIYYTVSVKNFSKTQVLKQGQGLFRTIQDQRERIRQSFLAATTGPGSAILQAMVIGEEGRLTDDLRDRFMAAGVTHIISISGSHLGMVAILCFGFLRSLLFLLPERWYHQMTLHVDPRKIAAWLTLPLVIFYTLLAGGQVATIRSLIMISAGLLALVLDRDHALLHSLALAALFILIVSPQAIFDISFQLSYLSVLVIGYVVTLGSDLKIKSQGMARKIGSNVLVLIAISLATSLATGPLVALYFNQFSFAGIISNIVVVPFAGMVVVPLGLVSAILSLFTHSLPLAAINQLVCDSFVSVVDFFSRLPFAEFHPPAPGILWLLFYGIFLLSLAAFARARLLAWFKPLESSLRIPRVAVIGMAVSVSLLTLSLILPLLPKQKSEISFLDVGQGDCALVQLRSGKTILIDGGGTYDNRFDIGRRVVAPYLWNKGIRAIDLVVLSHPHPDHMNGLQYILKQFPVAQVWESGRDPDLPGYADFSRIIAEQRLPHKTVSVEDPPIMLGEAELRVLHPSHLFGGQERQAYAGENNRSLVLRIAFDDVTCLFTGDIGAQAEQHLARIKQSLKSDVVKVPHHGSKSSSSENFVAMAQPKVAIISVGKGNRYNHPSGEVLARYEKNGTKICRTDQDGAVTVTVHNGRLETAGWNDLVLARIDLQKAPAWAGQEQRNWGRFLGRMIAKYS